MSFYDEMKEIDSILGVSSKKKAKVIRYPSWQTAKILTVHLRRKLVPRQLNIRSGGETKTWMYKEGGFNPFFKQTVFTRAVKETGICKHCVIGAWAYVRVGIKTHVLWMKGEGKNIDFIQG